MTLTCDGKKPYHTPEAAARAARGRDRDGVTYLRVYACPECGAFHLTSKRPDEVGKAKSGRTEGRWKGGDGWAVKRAKWPKRW